MVRSTLEPMAVSLAQVRRVAAGYGHNNLRVEQRGTWWVAACGCGYTSARRRTTELALGAVLHHVRGIFNAWQAAGSPALPALLEDDTPAEERSNVGAAL